jgi:hypothetical protein
VTSEIEINNSGYYSRDDEFGVVYTWPVIGET